MKVLRRTVSVVLSLLMIMSVFTIVPKAYAATGNIQDSSLTYTFDESTGTLTISGTGEMPDFGTNMEQPWYSLRYDIKKLVVNEGVTRIGTMNFMNLYYLNEMSLPVSLTFIGRMAFRNMAALTEIVIPDGVVTIDEMAFIVDLEYCRKNSKLKKIVLGENVESIGKSAFMEQRFVEEIQFNNKLKTLGNNAFYFNQALPSVSLPDSVEEIGAEAFGMCVSLKNVHLGSGLKKIGDNAFTLDNSLQSINIPKSVQTIGANPFTGTTKTFVVDFDNDNPYFTFDGKAIYGNNKTKLISFVDTGNYIIPDGVTEIAENAFNASAIKKVTIPNSVTTIGRRAFFSCFDLTDVIMGCGLVTVGTEAFRGCAALTEIAFPITTTQIGESAFYGCASLTSALILNDHVEIGSDAFAAVHVDMTIKSTEANGNLKAFADSKNFAYQKVTITTPASTEITSIVGLQYNEIKLQWKRAENANGYIIVKSSDGGLTYSVLTTIDDGNVTHFSDYAVNINKIYYYKVAAVVLENNLQILSEYTEPASAITRLDAATISSYNLVDYNSVYLEWNEVPGADGYYIYTRLEYGTKREFVQAKKELDYTHTILTGLNTDMDTSIQVAAFRLSDDNREISGDAGQGVTVHPVLSDINITNIKPYDFQTIKIEWNKIPGTEEYRIEYSKNSNMSDAHTITVYDTEATSYLITKLDSFVQYFVRIKAVRANAQGETISESGISAATPYLEKVSYVKAERIGLVNVDLEWSAIEGANGYRIYRQLGNGEWTEIYQASAEQTTFTANDLYTDKEYKFKVLAYRINSDDAEVRSDACEAPNTIVTTFDPPVITEGKMTAYNTVSIVWNKSVGATGYEIWRSTDGGAYELAGIRSEENKVNAVDTYYFNDTVTTGNVYVYKVIGYYETEAIVGYEKQYTADSNKYTVNAIPTTPVVSITGKTYESLSLDWQDINGAAFYYIQWTTVEEAQPSDWQTYQYACPVSEYTMHGLETNVTYYFRIYATNETEDSYSKCSAVISGVPVLNVPEDVKATVENYNDVRIEWAEVPGASGYRIMRKNQNESSFGLLIQVDNQVLSYNDTDVITGITYSYKIIAYRNINNDLRLSEDSEIVDAKPVLNPTIFVNGATRAANYRTDKLAWNAVPGAIEYRIYRSIDDGEFVLYETVNSEKSSYEDTQAVTGRKNSYYVVSYRSDIATSTSVVVDLYPILEKAEITGYDVNSSESIKLYWDEVEGATAYDVYYATTEGGPYNTPLQSVSTSYEVEGLRSNQTYYFYVVAKYTMDYYEMGTAFADHSDIYQACINLKAPENRTAQGTSTSSVQLTWDAVENVAGYRIYRHNGTDWELIGEVPAPNCIFNDNNLKAGMGYNYKICTYLMNINGNTKVESNFGNFNAVATKPGKVTLTGEQNGEFNTVVLSYSASSATEPVTYIIRRKMGAGGAYETIAATQELTYSDTNAETGKIFVYKVVPSVTYEDYYIEGEDSNEIEAKTFLESPVIQSLTQVDYNAATLVWNSTEGADGYIIYRSLNNDNKSWSEIAKLEGNDKTVYTDDTLTCNVEYFYAVCPYRHSAVEGGDDYIGETKNPASITTKLDKGIITELVSTGYRSMKMTWKKVNGAAGYRVYRSTNGKDLAMVKDIPDGNTLEYTTNDLTCGMTYYYSVCAYNMVGNKPVCGEQADVKSVKILPSTPNVTSVKATSRTSVAVKWTKVDGADSYTVYRSEKSATSDMKAIAETGMDTLKYNDTGLTSGKTYYYTVKANRGTPPVKSKSNDGKKISLIPETPTVTKVAATAYNKIRVNWNTVSDSDTYIVYRSLSEDKLGDKIIALNDSSAKTYVDNVSECGVTYYYTVRAYWKGGALSNYNKGIGAHTVPTQTNIKSASSTGYKSIKLVWTEVKEADGYIIYRTESSEGKDWKKIKDITKSSTIKYTDSTVETGKTYFYTIRSYVNVEDNKIMASYDKTGKSAKAIPSTPKISAAKVTGVKSVKLTWSKIDGVNGYEIYRSTKDSSGWAKIKTIKDGSKTTFTDSNAVPGQQYYYTMKAYTTVDSGNVKSGCVTPGIGAKTTFTTPKISSAKAVGYNSVELTWSKIAGVDGYYVYRSTKSTSGWKKIYTAKPDETKYTDAKATYNTQFYYTIKAFCKIDGKEYASSVVKPGTAGKAEAVPPTFSLKSVGYDSIEIKWNIVPDTDGYVIYRTEKSDGTAWKKIKTIKNNKTTSYTDTGLECGKTYYYTMKSYKSIDSKNVYSSYNKKGIACKPIPATPTVKASQLQDKTVLIEWEAVAGAEQYKVYRRTIGGSWQKIKTFGGDVLVEIDTTAEADVVYEYIVKAFNNNISSGYAVAKMEMYAEPV